MFSRKIVTDGERRRRFLSGIPFNTENGPIARASAPGDTSAGGGGRRRPRRPEGAAGFRGRGEPAPAVSGAGCTHRCRRPKKNIRRDEKYSRIANTFSEVNVWFAPPPCMTVTQMERRRTQFSSASASSSTRRPRRDRPGARAPALAPPRAARVAFSFQ